MAGGVFGSKGKDAGEPSRLLEKTALSELGHGADLRRNVQQQGLEALLTGNAPTSQIPLVQRALEQVLMAGSQARQQTTEQLASNGVANTPFASQILSNLNLQNATNAALVPSQVAQSILDRGLGTATAGMGVGMQGLGQGAQVHGNVQAAQTQADAGIFNNIMNSMMQLGMAAGGAALGGPVGGMAGAGMGSGAAANAWAGPGNMAKG